MKKFEAENIKKITYEMMKEYIFENCPEEKAWFKKVAYSKADGTYLGRYNHLNAVKQFCGKFAPDLLPTKKSSPTHDMENW